MESAWGNLEELPEKAAAEMKERQAGRRVARSGYSWRAVRAAPAPLNRGPDHRKRFASFLRSLDFIPKAAGNSAGLSAGQTLCGKLSLRSGDWKRSLESWGPESLVLQRKQERVYLTGDSKMQYPWANRS